MDTLILLLIASAAIVAVILPIAHSGRGPKRAPATGPHLSDDRAIEEEVERYRGALRAGTLCGRCLYANPVGSNYCADCGRPLDVED